MPCALRPRSTPATISHTSGDAGRAVARCRLAASPRALTTGRAVNPATRAVRAGGRELERLPAEAAEQRHIHETLVVPAARDRAYQAILKAYK